MTDSSEQLTIAVCGDWHGDLGYAEAAVRTAASAGANHIMQVGDFGFWPRTSLDEGPGFLMRVEELLSELEIPLWWVDGNHEDFNVLETLPLDEHGRRPISHHVTHIPRGHRWTWEGHTWMGFGGAASVDRSTRTLGRSWFPQEYVTPEEVAAASRAGRVDVLVTHDAPFSVPFLRARLAGPSYWPQEDVLRSNKNQLLLDDLVNATQPRRVFHGHHHVYYSDVTPRGTEVVGLDCNAWDFGGEAAGLDRNIILVNSDGSRSFLR